MTLRLGSTAVSALYLGDQVVKRAYLGSNRVWPPSGYPVGMQTSSVSTGTAITVNVPTEARPGDALFLFLVQGGSTTEPVVTSGWALTGGSFTWGATRIASWDRIVASGDPTSYSFTMRASSTHMAIIIAVRGTTAATGTAATFANTANATTIPVPAASHGARWGTMLRLAVFNSSTPDTVTVAWPVSTEYLRQRRAGTNTVVSIAFLEAVASGSVAAETVTTSTSGPRGALSLPLISSG